MPDTILTHPLEANGQPSRTPLCRHIMPSGRLCRAPRPKGENTYCYFHGKQQQRNRGNRMDHSLRTLRKSPVFEDRAAIQIAITEVLRALASNRITERKAGLLLYSMQLALTNLGKAPPMLPG